MKGPLGLHELSENYRGIKMKKIPIVFLFFTLLVSYGCFHGEKITRVQPGMTVEQVKTIMGPQEGYKKFGDYEVYPNVA